MVGILSEIYFSKIGFSSFLFNRNIQEIIIPIGNAKKRSRRIIILFVVLMLSDSMVL